MKYVSSQLLEKLYAETETNINHVIATWQLLPHSVLAAAPAAGAWSAAQCLDHVNSYGRYYLPAMEKTIASASATRPSLYFTSSWLGNYFYTSMLVQNNGRSPKKMQSPKNHRPLPVVDTAAVLDEFISQLEILGNLLTKAQQVDINKAKVAISIAPFIRLKLGDTLLFVTAHINRHLLQAQRAIEAATAITNNRLQLSTAV